MGFDRSVELLSCLSDGASYWGQNQNCLYILTYLSEQNKIESEPFGCVLGSGK